MTDATTKKYTLHYGGQPFAVKDTSALEGFDGTPGTVKVRLANDEWLTIAVGPGIPMAIEEKTVPAARQSRAAFVR